MKFVGLLITLLLFAATDAFACHPLVQCSSVNSTPRKITICHHTGSESNPIVTITIDESALSAHLSHGDSVGECPISTPTPTKTPTSTPTPCPPTATPTSQPTSTPTPKPTESPSNTPTPLPTTTPTPQPTPTEPPATPTPNPTKPPSTPTPEPTPTLPNECPLEPTGIDKKKLLGYARTLERKAVKYYGISGKCGNRKSKKQIFQVSQLLKLFKNKLESFPVEVEICGDDCVEVVTKERLNELRKIAREISKHAVRSQHYGSLCHQKGKGIAGTKPIIDEFNDEVNSCPTHVCPT